MNYELNIRKATKDDAPLIAKRLSTLKNITAVDILAYHNFSGSKYDALSLKNTMPDLPSPTNEEINRIRVLFSSFGLNVNDLEN